MFNQNRKPERANSCRQTSATPRIGFLHDAQFLGDGNNRSGIAPRQFLFEELAHGPQDHGRNSLSIQFSLHRAGPKDDAITKNPTGGRLRIAP